MIWALGILLSLGAAVGVIYAFVATASQFPSKFIRVLYSAAVISAGAAVLKSVASAAAAPQSDLNACQLAHVVAMTLHHPLYPDPSTGELSAWTDGPLAAALLAPSALGKGPTSQIILGVCLNLLVVLMPTFWLLWNLAGPARRAIACLWFALILWWMSGLPSLNGVGFAIGPDGLAVGLIVVSLTLLMGPRDALRIALSSSCIALACWTKLSAFPLICAPLVFLAIADRPRHVGLFLISFLVVFCLIGLILIPIFGARGMWFQMITLPLAQPWTNLDGQQVSGIAKVAALGGGLLSLVHESRVPLSVLGGIGLLAQLLPVQSQPRTFKTWLGENAWIMLPLSALLIAPGELLEFLKMGRDPASFGLFGFLIAVTGVAIAIRAYRSAESMGDKQASQLILSSISILLVWESIGMIFTAGGAPALMEIIRNASANRQETALIFAHQHPEQTFFPWNTLSTLLIEGKLYPSNEALRLRSSAGSTLMPSVSQLTDHLPRNVRWIAIDASHSNETLLRFFPRATARVDAPGLEGFVVYTEPGVTAPR